MLRLPGVLPDEFGWKLEAAQEYVALLVEIADAAGGTGVEPAERVTDCPHHEDTAFSNARRRAGPCSSSATTRTSRRCHPWRGTPVVTAAEFVTRTDASAAVGAARARTRDAHVKSWAAMVQGERVAFSCRDAHSSTMDPMDATHYPTRNPLATGCTQRHQLNYARNETAGHDTGRQ